MLLLDLSGPNLMVRRGGGGSNVHLHQQNVLHLDLNFQGVDNI